MKGLATGVFAFAVTFAALYVLLRVIGEARPLADALKYAIIGMGAIWTLEYSRRRANERSRK